MGKVYDIVWGAMVGAFAVALVYAIIYTVIPDCAVHQTRVKITGISQPVCVEVRY